MQHTLTGQFIGGTIERLIWFAVGAYVAWFRPVRLRREVLAGKITEMERQSRIKKFSPLFGYLLMVAIILWALVDYQNLPVARPRAHPTMEMHRQQATTRDPSGWYLAASTEGSFSVLIPVAFNDFTVSSDEPGIGKVKIYTVGATTPERIKFSASEIPNVNGKSTTNLVDMAQSLRKTGQTLSEIESSFYETYPSVLFSLKDQSAGCYFRYVETPQSLIMVALEYPQDQEKTAEHYRSAFLSSLKIKEYQGGR